MEIFDPCDQIMAEKNAEIPFLHFQKIRIIPPGSPQHFLCLSLVPICPQVSRKPLWFGFPRLIPYSKDHIPISILFRQTSRDHLCTSLLYFGRRSLPPWEVLYQFSFFYTIVKVGTTGQTRNRFGSNPTRVRISLQCQARCCWFSSFHGCAHLRQIFYIYDGSKGTSEKNKV